MNRICAMSALVVFCVGVTGVAYGQGFPAAVDGVAFKPDANGRINAGCSSRVVTTIAKVSASSTAGKTLDSALVSPNRSFAVLEPVLSVRCQGL